VDGTPVNEPGNAVDFSNFTLDNIDKVEVVRGAESAIYGTDAVAGVVQVFTHRGTTRTPEVSVFGEGGTFGTGRGGAQVSGLLGNFDYSAGGSYFGTDGPMIRITSPIVRSLEILVTASVKITRSADRAEQYEQRANAGQVA